MAASSIEIEYASSSRPRASQRRLHPSPVDVSTMSQHQSPSFLFSSSCNISHGNRAPATPFASDDDRSRQGELSCHFEPTRWLDGHSLGGALTPWAASAASSPSSVAGSRIFRSAKDFYLPRASGGFNSFTNPYYEYSNAGYDALQTRRLELHSFVAPDTESSINGRNYTSAEYSNYQMIRRLSTIKEVSEKMVFWRLKED